MKRNTKMLGSRKISCPNGREIEIELTLTAENKPAYVRIRHAKRGERAETVILPANSFSKFQQAIFETGALLKEFSE